MAMGYGQYSHGPVGQSVPGACDPIDSVFWFVGGLIVGGIGTFLFVQMTGEKTIRGAARRTYRAAKRVYG